MPEFVFVNEKVKSNIAEKLIKNYSDRTYQHTVMITHKGTPIAFAMDEQRRLFYAILDLNDTEGNKGEFDVAYWPENPSQLSFPCEIEQVGYSIVGATRMPVVKLDTRQEAAEPTLLLPEEVDPFLSTTARLTADAPFQVFSDNQHIFVFRQAIANNHPDAVYKLNNGTVSGDSSRSDLQKQSDGSNVPVVESTLLCDRFILSGKNLLSNREVRYQRSRHKTNPASQTDGLGSKDMEGNPFYEPTQELAFIRNLSNGGFTVLQLPTQVNGIKRWQFFAHNSGTGRIDAFNLEVSEDGLFNPQGTQLYTSPDPQYRNAVLEREPGSDPFTGAPLISVSQSTNHAETALTFDGSSYVDVPLSQPWQPTAFTLEFWLHPAQQNLPQYSSVFSSINTPAELVNNSFQIESDGSGNYRLNYKQNNSNQRLSLAPISTEWHHLAISYDGTTLKTFINGQEVFAQEVALSLQFELFRIGINRGGNLGFEGEIDEVRIWNYARTGYDITCQYLMRLIGNEPGLVAYWRLDEGAGNTVFDQTDNGYDGTINGNAQWVASDANLGDHAGMRRSSFSLTGRTLVGSLAAKLYYQQEEQATGYDNNRKPMKKNARVMVTTATQDSSGNDPAVAAIDVAISREGRLAGLPDAITLPVLEKPEASGNLTEITNLEGEIRTLTDDIEELSDEIADLRTQINQPISPTNWNFWCTLRAIYTQGGKSIGYLHKAGDGKVISSNDPNLLASQWRFGFNSRGYLEIVNRSDPNLKQSNYVVSQPMGDLGERGLVFSNVGNFENVFNLKHKSGNSYELTFRNRGMYGPLFYMNGVKFIGLGTFNRETLYPNIYAAKRTLKANADASQFQLQIEKISLNKLLAEKELLQSQKETQLSQKLEDLGTLSGGQNTEIRLPMRLVHIDTSGLTINGSLMKFASATNTPTLLDGATGELTLYYPDQSGQFMAAYFQTLVARTRLQFPDNSVTLFARFAGNNAISGTISNGSSDDICTLVITNSDHSITETWTDLPRDPQQLVDILNGTGERPETVTATIVPATYSVKKRSLQVLASVSNDSASVTNGEATIISGRGSVWSANAPGRAYYFGADSDLLSLPSEMLPQTAMKSDLTVEAWVNPSDTCDSTVRLLHHNSDDAAYTLALQENSRAEKSALNFDGSGDYVEVAAHRNPTSAITVSLWAKSNTVNWSASACLASKRDAYVLHPNAGTKTIRFYVYVAGGGSKMIQYTLSDITQWHHYAGTFDGTTAKLYIDGVEVASSNDVSTTPQVIRDDNGPLYLGKDDYWENRYFNGQIDEVRIWSKARSASEIQADLGRRLDGNESGLVAYYTFHDRQARDRGPNGYHGTIRGNSTLVETCDPLNLKTYNVIAGVSQGQAENHQGQRFLKSKETISAESWNHIALRFRQSYGLRFNGASYLDCGNNQMLDIAEDLTIEVFLQLERTGIQQGIIGKGFLGENLKSVPYQLSVGSDNKLIFTFEDADGGDHTYCSNETLNPWQFYRIAVTRKKGRTQKENKGNKTISYEDENGDTQTKNIEVVESVDLEEWMDIALYINGVQQGDQPTRYNGEAPLGNDEPLEIGRCSSSPRQKHYFQGIISEIRLWNAARNQKDLGKKIHGSESGLVSWWQLEDKEGNVATDSKSSNHGKMKGARWVKNPDPQGSPFNLLLNGLPLAAENIGTLAWGDLQLSMAGYQSGGSKSHQFRGILEEVRIWRTLRTDEQIGDNLFTRLKGETKDLLAYYTFDGLSTRADTTQLRDNGLRGNHLSLPSNEAVRPRIFLSTAPIGNDTAAVRSALAGVETDFHEQIDSTPGVVEYADLQRDSKGNMGGVLKRCYSYLQNGQWQLVTGYKVGNLVAEWIGQAQFDPQVIGYVEGAPPVPSENLNQAIIKDITGVSEVEVVESGTVTYNLSASKEGSFDMGFSAAAALTTKGKIQIITAPLGIGVGQDVEVTTATGLHGDFNTSDSWSNEESLGTSINKTQSLAVSLTGTLEQAGQEDNPAIGPRGIPENMGFALVQSQTADIFALRLAHNNALVSFRMMPNPDIPLDWNIIPFKINPFYTKQGTLDGRIGYDENGAVVLDESYANARGYGEYSYFKPKEAYAIQKRIEREQQRLLNYYASWDTDVAGKGRVIGAAAGAAAGILAGPIGVAAGAGIGAMVGGMGDVLASKTDLDLPEKFAKRNIVNTYVWTADGGFFAETTETTDVKSEVSSGSFSFSGSVGGSFELAIDAPVGLALAFDASLGGGINMTKTKSKDTEQSFSLSVSLDLPRNLQKYTLDNQGDWNPVYDKGEPVKAAGKVDAYRFKTFYLDSSERNFEDLFGKVVDPIWLASDHPNAVALSQANQSDKKPPCWRVFHRVTFVSRILPDFPEPTAAPLESTLKAQNIDSNWQLIQKLDPFVRNHTQDLSRFGDAVRRSLQTYLPELVPHSNEIISYLALYYGIES